MEDKHLVSVIIPTYKRPDFLDRAIDSVLSQTYKNIEIIVVDDNNPDTEGRKRTEAKMAKYADDPRVHYIKHEYNKNGSAARNTGVRASKGDFVAFLDDDDRYLPKKIESQVNKLLSLPSEWGFCYNQYYTQKGDGPLIPVDEHREGDLYLISLKHAGFCINVGSNAMVRREAFEAVNGFDESFRRNQDHEFMVRLLHKYKVAYVSEPGLVYTVGTTNVHINYEETLNHYIEAFKPYIDELDEVNRKDFYRRMNRYRFSNRLLVGRDIKGALKLVTSGKVSILDGIDVAYKIVYRHIKRRIQLIILSKKG